ncbi:Asp23/Gls24 family envelope stress response protein [Micromonospora sp. SL4-19]|uniref:Asp23/Gls24 family envelope stress response protein n=1 Tax=Micromonospora sp. SL4-19 TaxID=3399129 RepID=UPI003A4DE301
MTGTLPRRGASAPDHAAALPQPWTEQRIARLAEDAAQHEPPVSCLGATVRVDGDTARMELDLIVDHGVHLPTVTEAVRRRVAARVEADTDLAVEAVTVTVVDLRLPAEAPAGSPSGRTERSAPADGRAGEDAREAT